MKDRSDTKVKLAFCQKLMREGWRSATIINKPTDIYAVDANGVGWFFELKWSDAEGKFFAGLTITELEQYFKDPEHFRIVLAWTVDDVWQFDVRTYDELTLYCRVPPFKINLYFDPRKPHAAPPKRRRSVVATNEVLRYLITEYATLRDGNSLDI